MKNGFSVIEVLLFLFLGVFAAYGITQCSTKFQESFKKDPIAVCAKLCGESVPTYYVDTKECFCSDPKTLAPESSESKYSNTDHRPKVL